MKLNDKDKRILKLLARGMSHEQVAKKIGLPWNEEASERIKSAIERSNP